MTAPDNERRPHDESLAATDEVAEPGEGRALRPDEQDDHLPRTDGEHDALDAQEDTGDEEPVLDTEEAEIPERPVVVLGRRLFLTVAAIAALLIVGLGATTAFLLVDRRGADDPIVATANGEPIRRSEYDRAVARQNGSEVLDALIVERLIQAEGKKRGITVDDQEVGRLLDEQKQEFGSDDQFQAALMQAGLTEQELRERLRIYEIARRLVADQTAVTDQEITQRYEATKDRYAGRTPEQAREQVKAGLESEKAETAISALVAKLRADAKIETRLPGTIS